MRLKSLNTKKAKDSCPRCIGTGLYSKFVRGQTPNEDTLYTIVCQYGIIRLAPEAGGKA